MDETVNREAQRRIETDPVLACAADWFVELQSDQVPVERLMDWQRWLAQDERHRAAYRSIESLWSAVPEIDSSTWPAPDEVSADRYDAGVTVSSWRERRRRRMLPYALAASVLVAAALAATTFPTLTNLFVRSNVQLQTSLGERRVIELSDGSTVTLGGLSEVVAAITGDMRTITLDSGEAFFEVAKDARRPFVVRAGNTAVTAIGTQFNVRHAQDQIVVAVAEGIVRVDTAREQGRAPDVDHKAVTQPRTARLPASTAGLRLTAGEQLSVMSSGAIDALQLVDTSTVGGWRSGTLRYIDEPLERIVADVHRYSNREIEIADASLSHLKVTGTVFQNDVDSWVRTLEAAFPVRASYAASGKIVLKRADASAAQATVN